MDRLAPLGRKLYDTRVLDLWERDTATLPRALRRRRRAYREFSRQFLSPLALEVDADPESYDPWPLLTESAKRGFQSEQLPAPLGTMPVMSIPTGLMFHTALKAEEFSAGCAGLGLAVMAHDLGAAALMLSGDLTAIRRWLVPLCRANRSGNPRLAAFAITEPGAGSDVEDTEGAPTARFVTTARRCAGGYVLNGQKIFISGGRHAHLVAVFAALEPDDGRAAHVQDDWTCFVVERGAPGFRTGRSEHKLGQRASDATELFFDDVFVPEENRVGAERSGWALNRNVLNYSRVPVAAIALGIAQSALEAAIEFTRRVRLGGRAALSYQEVQLAVADMWLDVSAMRGMVWQAARHSPSSQGVSSAAKAFCGDRAFAVANRSMDLLADHGSLSANRAEKAMRDSRLNQIYEGTNQINRLAVIEAFDTTDLRSST
ncbi:MAG: acyl-CoA dehydrogenase family protein [Acidimicrobiia bacterium]|nr:acyl-CoA dehydrogenase family protein [Acidimicrobiia bacterium]